jgi:hypothetical protein
LPSCATGRGAGAESPDLFPKEVENQKLPYKPRFKPSMSPRSWIFALKRGWLQKRVQKLWYLHWELLPCLSVLISSMNPVRVGGGGDDCLIPSPISVPVFCSCAKYIISRDVTSGPTACLAYTSSLKMDAIPIERSPPVS